MSHNVCVSVQRVARLTATSGPTWNRRRHQLDGLVDRADWRYTFNDSYCSALRCNNEMVYTQKRNHTPYIYKNLFILFTLKYVCIPRTMDRFQFLPLDGVHPRYSTHAHVGTLHWCVLRAVCSHGAQCVCLMAITVYNAR